MCKVYIKARIEGDKIIIKIKFKFPKHKKDIKMFRNLALIMASASAIEVNPQAKQHNALAQTQTTVKDQIKMRAAASAH